jgi:hypothetical protein
MKPSKHIPIYGRPPNKYHKEDPDPYRPEERAAIERFKRSGDQLWLTSILVIILFVLLISAPAIISCSAWFPRIPYIGHYLFSIIMVIDGK